MLLLALAPAAALAGVAGEHAAPQAPAAVQQGAAPTPAPASPPAASPAPWAQAAATWPAGQDASQCRLTCAQDSYACHATDHPDDCNRVWAECVAICNSPNLDPQVSTAP